MITTTNNPLLIYDAIVILGGGIDNDHYLNPWVKLRFDHALTHDKQTRLYIPLNRGTPYKSQNAIESEIGRDYLISQGVDSHRIIAETNSMDTLGGAYFTRTQITDPQHLAHLLIITSAFHLARTKRLFDWIFTLPPSNINYQLEYESVPDIGLTASALNSRKKKEAEGLQNLEANLIPRLNTLPELKHWIYTEHTAYAPGKHTPPQLDAETLKSY